jgi:hypothetical protein
MLETLSRWKKSIISVLVLFVGNLLFQPFNPVGFFFLLLMGSEFLVKKKKTIISILNNTNHTEFKSKQSI